MKFSDASRILNAGIQVMRTLGWAWRWAEWWVDYDSSWEPFLEPGQNENKMTKEELKIVDSTRESRCDDARRCRLPAFGAALRNRDYDTAEGFNIVALDRALRAVMRTKSLVGPFEEVEIDFFLEWLGRAYRSKSRLLCLGAHKNQVSENAQFCIHMADKSPKYVIGERPIPGTQELPRGTVFEVGIDESDDFMKRDLIVNSSSSSCGRTTKSVKKPPRSTFTPKSKRKRAAEDIIFAEKAGAVAAAAPSAVKKRVRDRPQSDRDLVTQHISAKETVTATRSLEERRDLLTVDDSDAIRSTELCAPAATISYSGKKRGRTAKVRYDLSSTRDSTTETATYSGLRHGRPKKKQKRNTFADALSESSQRSVDADTTDWIDQGHEFPVANAEVTSMRTEVCIEETPSSRPSMKLGVDVVPIGESRPLVVGTDTVQVTRGERELPSAATEANFVEINVGTEGKSLSVPAEATIFLETEGGDKDKQCK